MEVCTLASGSSGNAALVSCGATHILLDAGVSCRRIAAALKELGVAPEELSAVLVTHEHTDHIAGLATLTKKLRLPVYATAPTLRQLCFRIPFLEELCRPVGPGEDFAVGELCCRGFATSHDAAQSMGYALSCPDGKLALATDLGYLTDEVCRAVAGADLLICEANHDEDWLRSGPYPYYLQQRILGDKGHLSNEAGAELAARTVEEGAKGIVLAHLSHENNTPVRARQAAALRLNSAGIDPERDVSLTVAPRSEPGPVFAVKSGALTVRQRRGAAAC